MRDVKYEELRAHFEPIAISFVIESEDEFLELWHRLDMDKDDFKDYLRRNGYALDVDKPKLSKLCHAIEEIRINRGILPHERR